MREATTTADQSASTQPTSPKIEIPHYSRPKVFALGPRPPYQWL